MKTVGIIRERGQLTIPDSIRKVLRWVAPSSAVSISVVTPEEIVIRPHYIEKKVDLDAFWDLIKKSRAIKGKGKGSAVEFIQQDRRSR